MRLRREWPEHSHGWRWDILHSRCHYLSYWIVSYCISTTESVLPSLITTGTKWGLNMGLSLVLILCTLPIKKLSGECSQILGSISKRMRLIFFVRESEVWAQRYRWQLLNKLNKYLVRCRVVFQPGNLGRPWSLLCPRAGFFGWGRRPSCRKRCPPSEDRRQHPPAHWEDSLYTCPYRCVFAVRILGRRGID